MLVVTFFKCLMHSFGGVLAVRVLASVGTAVELTVQRKAWGSLQKRLHAQCIIDNSIM